MKWSQYKYDLEELRSIKDKTGWPMYLTKIFFNRNIKSFEDLDNFISFDKSKIRNPKYLPDIKPCIERIKRAIDNKEKIFIWGDYDVDGITATTVVVKALKFLGANIVYKVPHRTEDGYDIKRKSIDEALKEKATLFISVDCGILAFDAVEYANQQNLDVIITDHHTPSENGKVPNCIAVVNPSRLDSEYGFSGLAGVGIAFKVMMLLAKFLKADTKELFNILIEYVALGTIADVAPVVDENRVLIHLGCEKLSNNPSAGIKQLLDMCNAKTVDMHTVGFQIGPRINAIGRLSDANMALDLMLEDNIMRAKYLSNVLDTANKRRQVKQQQLLNDAIDIVDKMPEEYKKHAIVVGGSKWPSGIVGLIAGKLVEKYKKPALVYSENEDFCKGSARSIKQVHILNCLKSKKVLPLFKQQVDGNYIVGGHAFAAGFELHTENVDELRIQLNNYIEKHYSEYTEVPQIFYEATVNPNELTHEIFDSINRLAPFGSNNDNPILLTNKLIVLKKELLSSGKHLKLLLKSALNNEGKLFSGIIWNSHKDEPLISNGTIIDVVFQFDKPYIANNKDLFSIIIKDLKITDLTKISRY